MVKMLTKIKYAPASSKSSDLEDYGYPTFSKFLGKVATRECTLANSFSVRLIHSNFFYFSVS